MTAPIDLNAESCACHEDGVIPWEHFHEDGVVRHTEAEHNAHVVFDTPVDCESTGFKHKRHPYDAVIAAPYLEAGARLVSSASPEEELHLWAPPEFCHMLVGTTMAFATRYPSVKLTCTGGSND